ncbi:hypothetical protein CRX72_16240 [Pantoea sp. BRM17]|nr:hypothetical protein CRX72_16240 [Pantoea sp. BRM17]
MSTIVSMLGYLYQHSVKQPGLDAVLLDFIHVMVDMLKFNTSFLNPFWHNSPVPDFHGGANIGFWIVGATLSRQSAKTRTRQVTHFSGKNRRLQVDLGQNNYLYREVCMTYQQAGQVAILKRVAGWIIFIPALSTV